MMRRGKWFWAGVVILICGLAALSYKRLSPKSSEETLEKYSATAASGADTEAAIDHPMEIKPAPVLEASDATGKKHDLSEFHGKVVLLHFWASWCPPCLPEIPAIFGFAKEYVGKPVALVALSQDENWESAKNALSTLGETPPNVLSLLDEGAKISDRYGSYMFPETYLIDGKGQIVWKWVGPQDWTSPQVHERLNHLISTL